MEQSIFENRRIFHYWWIPILFWGVIIGGAVGHLFYHHQIRDGLITLIFFGPMFWFVVWRHRQLAQRIAMSDQGIEAWNYGGKHIYLKWNQIGALQRSYMKDGLKRIKLVLIISIDQQQKIVLTDLLIGFDEIIAQIRRRLPQIREEEPDLRERIARWF